MPEEEIFEKSCTQCGERKSLEMFGRMSMARDGRRPECKDCTHRNAAVPDRGKCQSCGWSLREDSKDAMCWDCRQEQIVASEFSSALCACGKSKKKNTRECAVCFLTKTRHCRECGIELDADNKRPSANLCKACHKIIGKGWYAEHKRREREKLQGVLQGEQGPTRCCQQTKCH